MFIDKKKLGIIGGVLLAIFFYMLGSGSSNNSTPAPEQTVEDTFTQPEVETLTPEEEYLSNLHSMNDWIVEANTDQDLIELGNTVCSVYDDGYSTDDIITELATSLDTSEVGDDAYLFAGHILGSAVKYLCPEYISDLQGYVNS
jgi:hypothetical protein